MKITGLDGKKYSWSLAQYVGSKSNNASTLHIRMRDFLEENFPTLQVLEEVYIPSERLYLDYFLPLKRIAVECQGDQHNEYTPFFHGNKSGYQKSMGRDVRKKEFCRINNISLIYVYENEDDELWKAKLGMRKN